MSPEVTKALQHITACLNQGLLHVPECHRPGAAGPIQQALQIIEDALKPKPEDKKD